MARAYRRKRGKHDPRAGEEYHGWCLDYVDEHGDRQRVKCSARTRSDARVMLAERLAEVEERKRNPYRDNGDGSQLFSEFIAEYLATVASRLREIVQRRLRLRYWTDFMGPKARLRDMTPERVHVYMARRLEAGRAPATVNRELMALKAALNVATDWRRIPFNPLARVKGHAEENVRDRVLSRAERAALLRAARASGNPALAVLLAVLLGTGGRRGETLALCWSDLRRDDKGRPMLTFRHTKTKRPRTFPIEEWVAAEIESLPRRGEHVFTTLRGAPLRDVRTSFHLVRERAGLGPDVTLHTLRHTFVTVLAERGVSPSLIQAFTGHADMAMVSRYSHPSEASLRQAIDGLNLGRPDLGIVDDPAQLRHK